MKIEIEDNQVHIWQARIDVSSGYPKDIKDVLSADERERAISFKLQNDQIHFIIRHYLLRIILSKYCDYLADEITFRYDTHKKPAFNMPEYRKIKFNMSFSHDLMLVAINKHNDIGIDIEKVHDINDLESVAVNNFSSKEFKYLNSSSEKINTFFKIWTRKEAFIKATGKGMYYPLKSFCVSMDKSGNHENLIIFNHPIKSKHWRIAEIKASDGFIASIAVKTNKFQISYFQL